MREHVKAFEGNEYIKMAVDMLHEAPNEEEGTKALFILLKVLAKRMAEGGEVLTPMVDKNHVMEHLDLSALDKGDTFSLDEDLRMIIDKIMDKDGNIFVPLYTDEEEVNRGQTTNLRVNLSIRTILEEAVSYEKSCGLVINPFGESVIIPKEGIRMVLDMVK